MSDLFEFVERYLSPDGKEYVDASCVRKALGIKEDENIFLAIKKLKEERDELKDKCDKLKKRANAAYGVSCGYSGDKAPTFRCDVISYSWSFGAIDTPFPNNSIRVELKLTPTANYKGTFDLEDLKKYIQAYGREKKLGIVESVDYQNVKAARAELAHLYKTVLGKEKLDTNLSPHEIMKAIHDEYKRVRDSQLAFSQSLQSVYMHVHKGTEYSISDIYAAPDKIADGIITRYDSAKKLSDFEVFCKLVNGCIDELCDKYNVVQPARSKTTRERLEYIFDVLVQYRECSDKVFNKAEGFRKEKRAVENSLNELRAKIREIYRSVVDDEWDEYLAYTSALNDINEEYKRVVHNFEERTADWSKAQQELDRYRLAVGSLLDIPKETRDDINAIERSFEFSKKMYKSLKELRDNVCEIFDIPSSMADDQEQILKEIHDFADRYYELKDFRANICEILGIDADELFGSPQQNDKYILEQAEKLKGNGYDALCGDYAELKHGNELLIEFRDSVAKAMGMDYPTTNQFIVSRVADIYKERGEAHDLAMELDRKCIDLTAKNSDLQQKFQFQSGLRQQWHARWESENERANGVQKALDREREKCKVKDISLETAKKQYEKVCNNLETAECALNGMKNKLRNLQEEKTKVISALGQDIWDDCLK